TQERQRFADHRFPIVVSPLTTRFFAIAADLREPRSIDVKLLDGRNDSDEAWLMTMPPVGRSELKAEVLRLFPEGTSVPGLGRDYATLWIAVFNVDPQTDKKFDLTLSLKQSFKQSAGTFRSVRSAEVSGLRGVGRLRLLHGPRVDGLRRLAAPLERTAAWGDPELGGDLAHTLGRLVLSCAEEVA